MKKILIATLCLLLVSSMLLASTGCARVSATELSAGYTRLAEGKPEVDENFASAVAEFSLSLFLKTQEKGECSVFNPC